MSKSRSFQRKAPVLLEFRHARFGRDEGVGLLYTPFLVKDSTIWVHRSFGRLAFKLLDPRET